MMNLIILVIAIVVTVAVITAMVVIAINQRKKAMKAAEEKVAHDEFIRRLERVRAERRARQEATAAEEVAKRASKKAQVEDHPKKHHRKKKSYGQLLVEDDLRGLCGRKRLVDKAGGTKKVRQFQDTNWELKKYDGKPESHYNVRNYKINNKAARKHKRAFLEAYMAEWCEPEYASEQ